MAVVDTVGGTLLDQAPDGVLLVSAADGTIVDVNATACELSGWSRDELVGRPLGTLIHQDDLTARPFNRAKVESGGTAVSERRIIRADGTTLWCQATTRKTDAGHLIFVREIADLMRDRQQLQRLMQVARLRTDIAGALLRRENVPAILDRVAAGLAGTVADLCVVTLVDRARELLVPAAIHHRDPWRADEMRARFTNRPIGLAGGLAGAVVGAGKPVRLTGLPTEEFRASLPPEYREYFDQDPVNSLLVAPLRSAQGILGTLTVAREPAFGDEEEEVFRDLADLIALAIEDARNDDSLRRTNFLLQTVTNALPALVSYWNTDLRCEFANEAYRDWFGLTSEQMHHRHARDLLGEDAFARFLPFIQAALAGERQEYDRAMEDASGQSRHVQVTYIPDTRPDGRVAGFVALATDVTPWTEAAAQFEYQALHDPLTGLRNRRSLLDHVGLALGRLRREGGVVALFFLDLDDFKQVNDREGHQIGDVVLISTADRIRKVIRNADTAARLGGDEFVVLCHVEDWSQADEIRQRLTASLSRPIVFGPDGRLLAISVSIGLAVADDPDATSPEDLLAAADAAMFRQKRGQATGG